MSARLPILFALIHAAAPAQDSGLRAWLASGLAGTVVMTDGDRFRATELWFETPADLTAGGPIFQIRAAPIAPDFERIHAIEIRRYVRRSFGLRAGATSVYRLGPTGRAASPPPDWTSPAANLAPWSKAVAVRPGVAAPFVPDAQPCWAESDSRRSELHGEFLFHHPFDIDGVDRVARATLRLAMQVDRVRALLNGRTVSLAGVESLALVDFEVSDLLVEGRNVLALWVRTRGGAAPAAQPYVAASIRIDRFTPSRFDDGPRVGTALLISSTGDRVWGGVRQITPQEIQLDVVGGVYRAPWELVSSLLFPYGWSDAPPPEVKSGGGLFDWLRGRDRGAETAPIAWGAPLASGLDAPTGKTLLKGARALDLAPRALRGEDLELGAEGAAAVTVPRGDVLALYPPLSERFLLPKPKDEFKKLYCRLTTTRGESLSGLLRRADAAGAVVETQGGDRVRVPYADLIRIAFPFHAIDALTTVGPASPKIGLLARAPGDGSFARTYAGLSAQVQEAIHWCGLEWESPTLDDLVDPAAMTAARFPVLVTVDPLGEFPDTVRRDGDARAALVNYVRSGGALVVYSRGGALRTAVIAGEGRFIRSFSRPSLASDFGLDALMPADASADVRPFDRPPNDRPGLAFQLAPDAPAVLKSLPPRVELEPMPSAQFYPLIAERGRRTLYALTSADGTKWGPGLSIAPFGEGAVIIIDHLLWAGEVDGEPFTRAALPLLLLWAAKGMP